MKHFLHTFVAMGCTAELRLYAVDSSEASNAFSAIEREVRRIEAKYSRYRADSVLSAINRSAGEAPVAIDAETRSLLDYADACWRDSDGLFDITSGVLRTVWDYKRGIPPDAADVRAVLARIGWQRIALEGESVGLEAGMEIDLGGIGKEYAADRGAAAAQAAGIRYGFVNLGGDIRFIGPQAVAHDGGDLSPADVAGGRPWKVGIVHPRAPDRTIAHLELSEGGLATSGDYERYFEFEGRRYCHILDPRTGWPVAGPQSVSVVAPLCTIAGSCSTIAMLCGDDAGAYLRAQNLPHLIIDRDGAISGTLG